MAVSNVLKTFLHSIYSSDVFSWHSEQKRNRNSSTKRELMIWVQDLMGFLILNVYLIAFYVIFPTWDPISWSQHPALELNITENFRHLWNTKNSSRRKTAKANKISMCGVDEAFILISNSYEVWQMNSRKYVCLWLNFFSFFV